MAKFNRVPDIAKELYERPDATLNFEGALAFKVDPLTELYLKAASCLVGEKKYYTDAITSDKDLLDSIRNVAKIDPEFILQLAVYCREQLYLRSVPLLLVAEFANDPNCSGKVPGARKYVSRVMQRADELAELMAYQLSRNRISSRKILIFNWNDKSDINVAKLKNIIRKKYGVNLSNSRNVEITEDSIKISDEGIDEKNNVLVKLNTPRTKVIITLNNVKIDEMAVVLEDGNLNVYDETKLPMLIKFALKEAFKKFDAYEISKYKREKKEVKIRDVMFMTHPKPVDLKQKELFKQIAEKTLESPETWEVMVSTGQMNWHQVINNIFNKGGRINNYMAQLKNLRNCLQKETVTAEDIILLGKMISDKNAVSKSKQLPFRFLSAYKELAKAENLSNIGAIHLSYILDAIETAAAYSVDNIPKIGGSTLIATDFSGSMQATISDKSTIERFEIGAVLSMIANRFCGHTITGIFADTWKVVPMTKSTGILKGALETSRMIGSIGYSTNGHLALEYLLDNNIKVDRIMVFTDCQMWDSTRRNYFGDRSQNTFADTFIRYQRMYPGVKLYSFDLSGYGTVMIPQDTRNVCLIGGWSDRIFDFVSAFEQMGDGKIVIEKIKAIEP